MTSLKVSLVRIVASQDFDLRFVGCPPVAPGVLRQGRRISVSAVVNRHDTLAGKVDLIGQKPSSAFDTVVG